jgi:translation elongation factor EF-Tu-like GTPase
MDWHTRKPDIEVELNLLTTEEGGRRTRALSGYRPQFSYDGYDWDAIQDYGDVEMVAPGETVVAYLQFLSPQCHVGKLYPGKEFLLREGSRVVGRGHVITVLHLEANAERARQLFWRLRHADTSQRDYVA